VDFDDPLSPEPSTTGMKVSHKYTTRSSFTVTLTVVDNDGESGHGHVRGHRELVWPENV